MSASKTFCLLYLILACSVTIAQYNYDELIPVELLKEDLYLLKANLEEVHPGLYAYHSKEEIDAKFSEIDSSLTQATTSVIFYRKLLPLLPLIANNHTKIYCPPSYKDKVITSLPRFPFTLYHRKGRSYIYKDFSDEQVIGVGTEILKINDMPMEKLLEKWLGFYSVDGFNTSMAYYGLGIAFSRYYAYYTGTPKLFHVEYRDLDGTIKSTEIKGLTAPYITAKRKNLENSKKEQTISFSIEDDIAYLDIPSFQPEKAIPFKLSVRNAFRDIKRRKVTRLIIDVRGNGGGYGEAADIVLRYLISETIYPYQDEFALVNEIPYPEYYDHDFFFKHFEKQPLVKKGETYHIKNISANKLKPKKDHYFGELIVLLNAASASATGEFLGLVKSYTNAIFIGEEAGGNPSAITANDLLSLNLPNSAINVTIPAIRTVMNLRFENDGHGVRPDYEIIPTIEDLLQKRDPVLEFAYSLTLTNE